MNSCWKMRFNFGNLDLSLILSLYTSKEFMRCGIVPLNTLAGDRKSPTDYIESLCVNLPYPDVYEFNSLSSMRKFCLDH